MFSERYLCIAKQHMTTGKKEVTMVRVGVVAVFVTDKSAVPGVQSVLSAHGSIICGRMGVPDAQSGKNVIALIVKGSVEQVSALTGALGRIGGVSAKSLLSKEE